MLLGFAILAVLERGPRHGYAVRAALVDLVGAFWPVNQGQVYATLARLSREGLVSTAEPAREDETGGERSAAAAGERSGPRRLAPSAAGETSGPRRHAPSAAGETSGPRRHAPSAAGREALAAWLRAPHGRRERGAHGFDDWLAQVAICSWRGDRKRLRAALDAERRRCDSLERALAAGDTGCTGRARQAARDHLAAEVAWLDRAERALLGDT